MDNQTIPVQLNSEVAGVATSLENERRGFEANVTLLLLLLLVSVFHWHPMARVSTMTARRRGDAMRGCGPELRSDVESIY